jgi:hypothetical protein
MSRTARTILIPCLFLFVSCVVPGSCDVEIREYAVEGDPHEISVCCGLKLTLSQGEEPSLRIQGDDNILDEIVVGEVGDRIMVEYAHPSLRYLPSRPVQVFATLTDVAQIEAVRGASMEAEGIDASILEVRLDGGSRGQLQRLRGDDLHVRASGGSRLQATGAVGAQSVQLSGGSRYDGVELHAETATLQAGGGSVAHVNVSRELDVEASGGSRVTYTGSPDVRDDVSGGSSVRSSGLP